MRTEVVDGLLTLFYDGSKVLYNENFYNQKDRLWSRISSRLTEEEKLKCLLKKCSKHWKERWSWEQVFIEEGVIEIPENTFKGCKNIKRVVFADTVTQVKERAFQGCKELAYVRLSVNLQCIGDHAFYDCKLSSVFIPPRCRKVGDFAFHHVKNLTLFNVPQGTELGSFCISGSRLYAIAPFDPDLPITDYEEQTFAWVKNINANDEYALHRACASYQPLKEVIYGIIEEHGLNAFNKKNDIGITPSRYLNENPFTDLSEMEIVRDYILKKMNF